MLARTGIRPLRRSIKLYSIETAAATNWIVKTRWIADGIFYNIKSLTLSSDSLIICRFIFYFVDFSFQLFNIKQIQSSKAAFQFRFVFHLHYTILGEF